MVSRGLARLLTATTPRRLRFNNWYLLTRTFLFLVKRAHRNVLWDLRSYVTGRVVDVGAGDAPYASFFVGATTYFRVDNAPGRRPDVVADAARLPVADGSADTVVCCEVLEHLPDPQPALRELARILRPDGVLLLTTPMSWGLHYEPNDYWRFTHYGLRTLLTPAGFTVIEERQIGGLFSLVGARLVEGIATALWHRLSWMPRRIRHGTLLLFSIPTSLGFACLGALFDRFIHTDAIGWAVVARRSGDT